MAYQQVQPWTHTRHSDLPSPSRNVSPFNRALFVSLPDVPVKVLSGLPLLVSHPAVGLHQSLADCSTCFQHLRIEMAPQSDPTKVKPFCRGSFEASIWDPRRVLLSYLSLVLSVKTPSWSAILLVAIMDLPASSWLLTTKISLVFKSTLRLQLPYALFQIKPVPLASTILDSVLPTSLSSWAGPLLTAQSWGRISSHFSQRDTPALRARHWVGVAAPVLSPCLSWHGISALQASMGEGNQGPHVSRTELLSYK